MNIGMSTQNPYFNMIYSPPQNVATLVSEGVGGCPWRVHSDQSKLGRLGATFLTAQRDICSI